MDFDRYDKFKEGIKKRRQERLELLKKKRRSSFHNPPSDRTSSISNKSFLQSKEKEDESHSTIPVYAEDEFETASTPSVNKLIVRIACAVLLVAAVYTIVHSDNPEFAEAEEFVRQVMETDFNVVAVMNWYEERVGEHPSFLPQIIKRDEVPDTDEPRDYVLPVSGGRVVSSFGQDQQGIFVGTASTLPIEVVKQGLVTFVGERDGLGDTVIIDHGDGVESWYGHLIDVQVQVYDWVEQGKVIGTTSVSQDSGEGLFYFAMRKGSVFINPLDVISFD